ncbi:nocobactin polyketide synthase NbtC [Mycobacterium sp. IS-1556]|uniref:nocobactin polyketide synthase NbtC n=1 Tax=Mycobacterium sp. IS-1556 TaxID=1772276 RepID=UPI000A4E00EB|nr:nocobactin polyketide synthase NbtC [Mycobacterium sp. IS-1556]
MPDGTVPVLLSADTPDLLRAEASALISYLEAQPWVQPQRVASMLFRTRLPRRYRALVMVTDRAGLVEALRAVADGRQHAAVVRNEKAAGERRRAYVLPGQGGQRPGMGALFYRDVPAFRSEADRCDGYFGALFGESPLGYLLGAGSAGDGTVVVQSALFMLMVALGAMWRSVGVTAAAVVGHSQGEIAGAYLSGKMTLEDAVTIVGTRARAVETISSDDYAMAVVAADRDECEAVLARQTGWAQVSVVNSPRLVGISGDRDTVRASVDTLAECGRFTRLIPVRYPAHTSRVNEFREVIETAVHSHVPNARFRDSEIDCIGSTLGEPVSADVAVSDYWFWNLRNIVRFDKAVATAIGAKVDTFVELAEHPTLQLAIQENLDTLDAPSATVVGTSTREAADLTEFTRNLALLAVDDIDYRWDVLRTEPTEPASLPLLDFPNTQMNEQTLWLPHHGFSALPADREPALSAEAAPPPAEAAPPPAEATAPPPAEATAPPQVIVEDWVPLKRRATVPPRSFGIVDHMGGDTDLVAALCSSAAQQGVFARPLGDVDDTGEDIDSVVVLVPALERMSQVEAAGLVAKFFVDRQWWLPRAAPKEYWLVTVDGENVVPADGAPHPYAAAISAGFRCLGGEYPDITFRHLDLAHRYPGAESAQAIIAALHTADEPDLALRDGTVYGKRLVEAIAADAPWMLNSRHVLITGGTGRVGLEFCGHAARHGARRITLVSRTGETRATTEQLRPLRALTEIRVIACDVADVSDVRRMAADIGEAPVDLVVHAVLDDASAAVHTLTDLTEGQFDSALRGKAVGISNVLDAVALATDCHVLLCSSTAAVLGGRGKIAYAAANRMLDAYAHEVRAAGRACSSVQWGQWAIYEGQSRTDIANLAEIGYLPMRSADAITLGLSGSPRNIMVAAFDWERAGAVLGTLGYGPTLSQLVATVARNAEEPARRAGGPTTPILQLLAEVIGAGDVQAVDSTAPLVALGLDSLNALQLRRRLRIEFSCEIGASDLLGGMSLDDVVKVVSAGAGGPAPTVAPAEPGGTRPSAPDRGVEQILLQLLAEVIGTDDEKALDTTTPLVALGLDSLNALQLRRRIKSELNREVAVGELLGGARLDDVTAMVTAAGPSVGPRPSAGTAPAVAPTPVGSQRDADLDADQIASAREDLDLFGLGAMWRLVEPVLRDGDGHTAEVIAERLHFAARHRWVLRQWLHELSTRGFVGLVRDDGAGGYRKLRDVPTPSRPDLVAVCTDLGYPAPYGRFLDDANRYLVDLVSDGRSVQELLFPDGATDRADAFYRDNAVSRYLNLGARTAVADHVQRLAEAGHSPVQILELGAGVGGMTDDLVAALTGLPVQYRFTDVSTFFLNAARQRYAKHPWMQFAIVDLNDDLSRQPACDIVVAANVVHNARDVGRTLREIHDLLRPGGAVVFIEVCKANCSFMTSVYFLMSPAADQPQVGLTDVRAGTDRILLTRAEWHRELTASGLTPVLTLPAADHPLAPLDHHVFVAVRGDAA